MSPARERLRVKLEKVLADDFPSVVGRVYPLELGPPVGWPVQYRVSGPDVTQGARDRAGARPARRQQSAGRPHQLRLDRAGAAAAHPHRPGRGAAAGPELAGAGERAQHRDLRRPVTQVRDDIYLVDVVVRATDEQRVSLATLRTLQVPLPSGRTVPLSQFATFEYEQEYPLVWRRDRVPTLTVQADVAPGTLPETVVAALAPEVDALPRACRGPIASPSAARSRKARSRRRPSSRSCR